MTANPLAALGVGLTVCVSCGGWEGGVAIETEKLKAAKKPKKRAAYPPSAARFVGQRISYLCTLQTDFLALELYCT